MKNKGFTIIELVLVVVITVIILAITIPLLPSGIQYNEASAIGNLKTVSGAQSAFMSYEHGYASTWKELNNDPIAAGKPACLDIDLSELVYGYKYTLMPAGDSLTGASGSTVYTDFTCTAVPIKYGEDSSRSFYVDASRIIRFKVGSTANKDSDPI